MPLYAQGAPPPEGATPSADASPSDADRELAKARFYRGLELFKQSAWAPALAEFLESRRAYPTWSATSYAATCLKKLERYDESLDMYAALVRDFGDKLSRDAKQQALLAIDQMKGLVATIDVAGAEPGSAIIVDQRARGDYPLTDPLRVPAGSHIVRVYKEGYEPFETRVDVPGGAATRVIARLRKLKIEETGTLEVLESLGKEMDVVVDSVVVGKTPLRIPFSPGRHTVLMRGADKFGTAPATVLVRVNEISTLRLEAERLSATLRVVPTPFDALVSIDSMLIGRGVAELAVRPGGHTVEVAAEGFLAEKRKIMIRLEKKEVVDIELPRDPKSPFWRRPPPPPHLFVELSAGVFVTPSLGGEVAAACGRDCNSTAGLGDYGVGRVGYQLSSGLGLGVATGYLTATQRLDERTASLNVVGGERLSGKASDVISLHGLLVGGWASYSLDTDVPLQLRLGAGGLLGTISDARRGLFQASDASAREKGQAAVGTVGEAHSSHSIYIAPEVRVGLPLGPRVQMSIGLELPILIGISTPRWSTTHDINAGAYGFGWFNDDELKSRVVVGFVPSVGGRFDR